MPLLRTLSQFGPYRWSVSLSLYLSMRLQDDTDTVGWCGMHICKAAGALYGSTMAGGNYRATWQELYEMSDRLLGNAEVVPWMPKKKAWHGLYKGETAEASLFLLIFHGRTADADQEMWIQKMKNSDAETIWFSHIWNGRWNYLQVWSAVDMTQICRFLADSPHHWGKPHGIVLDRSSQAGDFRWGGAGATCFVTRCWSNGPSWMYTTVYRWYMLIHRWYPTFCWFPILPPDLKKKNPAFFDWTKMRVRRDRSFAVASFSAKELTFLLGTAGMWNHETLPYAVDLDISWHFLTYPTKPGCSRWSTAPAFVNQDILLGFPCHHKAFWKKIWKFLLSPTHTTVLCCYVVLLGVLSMDGVVDVGKCGSHRVSGTTNCHGGRGGHGWSEEIRDLAAMVRLIS